MTTCSCVKGLDAELVMMAEPSVIAVFTVAVLTFSSSSQMLMVPLDAASRVVASPNALAPSSVNFRETKYSDAPPLVTGPYWAAALSIMEPSKISSPSALLPSRKVRYAVVPISSIAASGSKSVSPDCHGNSRIRLSEVLSTYSS